MDDLEFVHRCVKGEKAAWDEFVERYSRLIYSYIHSVIKLQNTKKYDPESINDIFQDIFLLLSKDNFKKLNSFKAKNKASLATWLRQVVINHTIDYIRKSKPLLSLEEKNEDDLSLKDIIADDSASVLDTLVSKEIMSHLKECIEKLDNEAKYFLELHINCGLKIDDIKDLLRASRGSLDMRKSRIMERLKKCFKEKGYALDF